MTSSMLLATTGYVPTATASPPLLAIQLPPFLTLAREGQRCALGPRKLAKKGRVLVKGYGIPYTDSRFRLKGT
jgi:hypothetical protein